MRLFRIYSDLNKFTPSEKNENAYFQKIVCPTGQPFTTAERSWKESMKHSVQKIELTSCHLNMPVCKVDLFMIDDVSTIHHFEKKLNLSNKRIEQDLTPVPSKDRHSRR